MPTAAALVSAGARFGRRPTGRDSAPRWKKRGPRISRIRSLYRTYQFLVDPLGTLGQELEVRVGVDVQNVYELSLEQGANVHPFLVHLLHSIMFQRKYNVKGINFF